MDTTLGAAYRRIMDTRPVILTESAYVAVGDEPAMGGYLARPAGPGPFPGVLVGMELFGISAHVRDVCDRLARLGYLALAPDLYHRSAPGIELPENAAGRERGFALLHQLTREQALTDVGAGVDHLRASGSDRVGMVGLSVGGHVAYLTATALDIPAVVVAYAGWIPTTDIPLSQPQPTLVRTPAISGRILFVVGEDDLLVPPEHRQLVADALRGANVRHELVQYPGAAHGFLSDRRDTHHPEAAADVWERIGRLLSAELT